MLGNGGDDYLEKWKIIGKLRVLDKGDNFRIWFGISFKLSPIGDNLNEKPKHIFYINLKLLLSLNKQVHLFTCLDI